MINPRILMQLPLLLLGSCVPLTPTTSITVYTGNTDYSQVRTSDAVHPSNVTVSRKGSKDFDEAECKKIITLEELRAYKPPPRADLKNVKEGDDVGVVDAVLLNNEVLRNELERLRKVTICTLILQNR